MSQIKMLNFFNNHRNIKDKTLLIIKDKTVSTITSINSNRLKILTIGKGKRILINKTKAFPCKKVNKNFK
jgi:competence protein ComGF